MIGQIEFGDKVLEKRERGKRIVEGIVPIPVGGMGGEFGQAQRGAEVAKGMRGLFRPGRAGQLEGVDPRTKGVTGEGTQKSLFRTVSVGHDRAPSQRTLQDRPEGEKRGGFKEIVWGDAVDLLSRPGDVLIALEERDERVMDIIFQSPAAKPDLHGGIASSLGSAGGFEINGSEDGFGNLDGQEIAEWGLSRSLKAWTSLA